MEPTYPQAVADLGALVRHIGDISDAALAATSVEQYCRDLIAILNRVLGHDGGAIQMAVPGQPFKVVTTNCDQMLLGQRLWHYLAEYRPEEMLGMTSGAYQDDEVWSRARRERLSIFEEVVRPARIRRFSGLALVRDDWLFGISVARGGDAGTVFKHPERSSLQAVFSSAAAGARAVQLAFASEESDSHESTWKERFGLSRSESQIASYVVRGMQNAEIGALLGLSRNTVRNSLARAFTKLGVSTRAELVYVLLQPRSSGALSCPAQAAALRILRAAAPPLRAR